MIALTANSDFPKPGFAWQNDERFPSFHIMWWDIQGVQGEKQGCVFVFPVEASAVDSDSGLDCFCVVFLLGTSDR